MDAKKTSSTLRLAVIVATLTAGAIALFNVLRQVQAATQVRAETRGARGPDRVASARAARTAVLNEVCRAAGLPYPPRELFLRAFKREGAVEAWAREDRRAFRLLKSFAVTCPSGGPGPKRREGDRQVPEGFYFIERFNPESSFHLSLGLNYPNASDRVLSDRERPGFDIFIHGGAASVGCLPIGDEAIEELYMLALDVHKRGQREIAVHIFPAQMDAPDWEAFAAEHPELTAFWSSLRPGFEAFEKTREVPKITVDKDGSYGVEGR